MHFSDWPATYHAIINLNKSKSKSQGVKQHTDANPSFLFDWGTSWEGLLLLDMVVGDMVKTSSHNQNQDERIFA